MKIFDYFRGLYLAEVGAENARSVISLMVMSKTPFGKVEQSADGTVRFFIRRRDVDIVKAVADRAGAEIKLTRTGFPALIKRYRRRLGIPIGAALALFTVLISSRFLWNIRISCSGDVSSEEVEAVLGEHGFFLGAYLPSVDISDMCRRIAVENEKISWISVNMRGTVAYVEVREASPADKEDISSPSNIIAACDGQIVLVDALGGKGEVKAGQTVKKGDVLISGVIDSTALGYRLVRSRGRVLANVTKTFSATEPLNTAEKVYTGAQKTKKYVKFFSKSAQNRKNIDVSYEKYDIIEETERLTVFGAELPVFITTVTYAEYTDEPLTLSEEEAARRAKLALSDEMAKALAGDKILHTYEDVTLEGDIVTVKITVECVSDIALEQKILTEQK